MDPITVADLCFVLFGLDDQTLTIHELRIRLHALRSPHLNAFDALLQINVDDVNGPVCQSCAGAHATQRCPDVWARLMAER